jgi:nucleotide-binding universal stress UspA family protein
MFHSILVPLDGSTFAEQVLPLALALARQGDSALNLVRVHALYALSEPASAWLPFDPEADNAVKKEERAYLDEVVRRLTAIAPVRAHPAVVLGLVADAVLERAKATMADLLVMSTHGRGPLNRFFLGSVADELVRRAPIPVLLVRAGEAPVDLTREPDVRNVLVPLDGSGLAEQALPPAVALARALGASLTLFRVVQPREVPPPSPALDWLGNDQEVRVREAGHYLERLAERTRNGSLDISMRLVVAPHAGNAIVAEAHPGDVIALATHGRGGVRRMLLGSVADKVIRSAATPVLVYRPPQG